MIDTVEHLVRQEPVAMAHFTFPKRLGRSPLAVHVRTYASPASHT